jgi:hypothetical protein
MMIIKMYIKYAPLSHTTLSQETNKLCGCLLSYQVHRQQGNNSDVGHLLGS